MAETKRTLLERIDRNTCLTVNLLTTIRDQQVELLSLGNRTLEIARQTKNGITMANQALTDLIAQFNIETNDIQARIDRLLAEIQSNQSNTVSPEQIVELQALSTRLGGLGQDPSNPIPTPT